MLARRIRRSLLGTVAGGWEGAAEHWFVSDAVSAIGWRENAECTITHHSIVTASQNAFHCHVLREIADLTAQKQKVRSEEDAANIVDKPDSFSLHEPTRRLMRRHLFVQGPTDFGIRRRPLAHRIVIVVGTTCVL